MDPALVATPAWPPPEFGPPRPDGTWKSPGYRSSWIRGRVLLGIVGVTIAASAIAVLQGLMGFVVLDAAVAGIITGGEGAAYDTMVALTGFGQSVLYCATGVALVAWLSRVVENVPPVTGYTPRRSPREAIGWWFVPVASWLIPYQVVDDAIVRLRTSPERGAERLVALWWITFLLMTGSSAVSLLAESSTDYTLDALRAVLTIRVAGDALYVVGGVLLLLIVREIERRSDLRAASLGLARTGAATWPVAAYAEEPVPDQGWTAPEASPERVVVSPDGPTEPPPPPG